ncbi:eCIS core domain-containing protein [Coleofasciculus sp.]|uniref:eCIS core domain-containing protein n=1 Tax=Coleofasciculus sp. TaxID=3100458 RepID=UPI003A209F9D
MYQQDKIQKSSLPVAQWATKKEVKGAVNAVQSRPENVASPAKENRRVMAKSRDGMLNNVLQTLMQGADSNSGASSVQATPVEEQKLTEPQGKGDWQQQADLSTIFGGSGSALPQGLMAKYQQLMPGVSLSHVRLHQGSQVDASLARAGLQGLTDGTRVAVSGKAESGTLEHELGHVAQRQVQGFNLTEGNRQAYEQDADRISARLVNGQIVEGFQGSEVKTNGESAQAKCSDGEKEDKRNLIGKADGVNGYQIAQAGNCNPSRSPNTIIEDIRSLLAPIKSIADSLNPLNIFRATPEEALGLCFREYMWAILPALADASRTCAGEGNAIDCGIKLGTLLGILVSYGYCVRRRMDTLSRPDQEVITQHLQKLDSLMKELECWIPATE